MWIRLLVQVISLSSGLAEAAIVGEALSDLVRDSDCTVIALAMTAELLKV